MLFILKADFCVCSAKDSLEVYLISQWSSWSRTLLCSFCCFSPLWGNLFGVCCNNCLALHWSALQTQPPSKSSITSGVFNLTIIYSSKFIQIRLWRSVTSKVFGTGPPITFRKLQWERRDDPWPSSTLKPWIHSTASPDSAFRSFLQQASAGSVAPSCGHPTYFQMILNSSVSSNYDGYVGYIIQTKT